MSIWLNLKALIIAFQRQFKGDFVSEILGFGIAGNFALHLEQAGEADDFALVKTDDEYAPKGIFPFYIKGSDSFLGRNCIDNGYLYLPNDKNLNIQMEPEIALRCKLEYENNKVKSIKPLKFAAFNDASVRNDKTATKISQKKNFSNGSKGIGNEIDIDKFSLGGICDNYSLVSFLQSQNELIRYGECAKLSGYSYFYEKLLEWIKDRLNTQENYAVLENLSDILKNANYPNEMIITIGATRYEEAGKNRYLKPGDICYVVAFDHTKFDLSSITNAIKNGSKLPSSVSILRQEVR